MNGVVITSQGAPGPAGAQAAVGPDQPGLHAELVVSMFRVNLVCCPQGVGGYVEVHGWWCVCIMQTCQLGGAPAWACPSVQEVQGGADHSRETVTPQGWTASLTACGPSGLRNLLQGSAEAGQGPTAGRRLGVRVLRGDSAGAGPILDCQILLTSWETPSSPALIIQGQGSLQLGSHR